MAVKKKPVKPVDVEALVERALATLTDAGVVKLSALGPTAARTEVAEALSQRGFEVTKTAVRRPLIAQLAEVLAQGRFLPLKGIAPFVRGGSAAEVKAAVASAIEQGLAVKVLRGNAEVLVPNGADTFSREELLSVRRALDSLVKSFAKASKQRSASLLREDVLEDLRNRFPELRAASSSKGKVTDKLAEVLNALEVTADAGVGLSFIPKVMAHLRPRLAPDTVRGLLLEAADKGLVELRPEGGLNRLSAEEMELCIPGPQGTRLSWARRIDGGAS